MTLFDQVFPKLGPYLTITGVEHVATSAPVCHLYFTLVLMHAFASPAFIRPQNARTALALEFELLHFLSQLLIQRFEFIVFISKFLSAVRACSVVRLTKIRLLAFKTKNMVAFRTHHWVVNKTQAERTPEVLNQLLVYCLALVQSCCFSSTDQGRHICFHLYGKSLPLIYFIQTVSHSQHFNLNYIS